MGWGRVLAWMLCEVGIHSWQKLGEEYYCLWCRKWKGRWMR